MLSESIAARDLRPGDHVLFDHFGGTDRPGRIVRLTAGAVLVEWTAPSSGVTRTVRLRIERRDPNYPSEYEGRNVRRLKEG